VLGTVTMVFTNISYPHASHSSFPTSPFLEDCIKNSMSQLTSFTKADHAPVDIQKWWYWMTCLCLSDNFSLLIDELFSDRLLVIRTMPRIVLGNYLSHVIIADKLWILFPSIVYLRVLETYCPNKITICGRIHVLSKCSDTANVVTIHSSTRRESKSTCRRFRQIQSQYGQWSRCEIWCNFFCRHIARRRL